MLFLLRYFLLFRVLSGVGTGPGLFPGRARASFLGSATGSGPGLFFKRTPFTVQATNAQREHDFIKAEQIRMSKRVLLSAAKFSQIELLGSAAANCILIFDFFNKKNSHLNFNLLFLIEICVFIINGPGLEILFPNQARASNSRPVSTLVIFFVHDVS